MSLWMPKQVRCKRSATLGHEETERRLLWSLASVCRTIAMNWLQYQYCLRTSQVYKPRKSNGKEASAEGKIRANLSFACHHCFEWQPEIIGISHSRAPAPAWRTSRAAAAQLDHSLGRKKCCYFSCVEWQPRWIFRKSANRSSMSFEASPNTTESCPSKWLSDQFYILIVFGRCSCLIHHQAQLVESQQEAEEACAEIGGSLLPLPTKSDPMSSKSLTGTLLKWFASLDGLD